MVPGPGISRALKATRDAIVDGEIGADEALEYALGVVHAEPTGAT
jgi:hypothetical protein